MNSEYWPYILEKREDFLERLFPLLRIPSVSAENPAGVRACCVWLTSFLEEAGFEVKAVGGSHSPNIIAHLGSDPQKKTVLIYGHYDVQPADPVDQWKTPPFEPTVRDGRVFCRGAGDNKGQFFAHFMAIELLQQLHGELPVNVRVLLDGGEESGSIGLEEFVTENKALLKGDVVYNADGPVHESGAATLWLGVKGNVYVQIDVAVGRRDAHSQYAAILPNAAWKLIQLLETLRDKTGRVNLPGFYEKIEPLTASEESIVDDLPDIREYLRGEFGTVEFEGDETAPLYRRVMFEPTFNISGLWSGYTREGRKTVLPATASVKIDARLVPNQVPEEIFDALREFLRDHAGDQATLRLLGKGYPSRTPLDNPFAQAAIKAYGRAMGSPPIVLPTIGACNPSYVFTQVLGMPVVNGAYANCDESNHAPNENLAIDYYLRGIALSAEVLVDFGRLG